MPDSIRLDKWLWAARFFKTRALATEAVNGGRVHLNGHRVKPARGVTVGDQLRIQRFSEQFIVVVDGLSDKRGPATLAQQLYTETEDSLAARKELKEMHRLAKQGHFHGDRRPTKKQRQQIIRFKRKQ